MKNLYYQNNKVNKNFFKDKKQSSVYYPIPLKHRKPYFRPGDLVGFKNFFGNSEGKILYSKRNKNGEFEYVVKMLNSYSQSEHVFQLNDMFLKGITRKVLFEKSPFFRRASIIKEQTLELEKKGIYLSGGTIWDEKYFK